MNPYIRPIKNLPPGVTGHLEIRNIFARRDWRDTTIGVAALVGAAYFALPALFSYRLPESVIGFWLLIYIAGATGQLRIFTPIDECSIRAVVEPVKLDEKLEEVGPAAMESPLASSPANGRPIPDSNGKVVNGG